MEYRLRPGVALGEEVRRIAYKQIDIAIGELTSVRDPHRSVHEARKCFKRVRALMHLVRSALGEKSFKKQDRRIRDVARKLSAPRDCQAMLETVSRLENGSGQVWSTATSQSFKAKLHRDRAAAEYDLLQGGLAAALEELADIREHYRKLKLKKAKQHIAAGLAASYRQARRHYRRSYKTKHDEDFHNWRISAQRHWRHMQLLWHAWPSAIQARIDAADELSKLLGYDHDLSVLMQRLRADASTDGEDFFANCRQRQFEFRAAANPHGARLFLERPDDFANRMLGYWQAAPCDELGGQPPNRARPARPAAKNGSHQIEAV